MVSSPYGDEPRTGQGRMGMPMGGRVVGGLPCSRGSLVPGGHARVRAGEGESA